MGTIGRLTRFVRGPALLFLSAVLGCSGHREADPVLPAAETIPAAGDAMARPDATETECLQRARAVFPLQSALQDSTDHPVAYLISLAVLSNNLPANCLTHEYRGLDL